MRKRKYPIMTGLIAMMKRGDVTALAESSKCNPQIVTDVIRGRRNIATYPLLAKAIEEFIVKREQELMITVELQKKLGKVLSKLELTPPTDEEVKYGGRRKTQVEIYRMERLQLSEFINFHKLPVTKLDIKEMDIDDLREDVWELYSEDYEEKQDEGFWSDLF